MIVLVAEILKSTELDNVGEHAEVFFSSCMARGGEEEGANVLLLKEVRGEEGANVLLLKEVGSDMSL